MAHPPTLFAMYRAASCHVYVYVRDVYVRASVACTVGRLTCVKSLMFESFQLSHLRERHAFYGFIEVLGGALGLARPVARRRASGARLSGAADE